MHFWLVKSEPSSYSWQNLLQDKQTVWDGVRNYQAKKYLAGMKLNDIVLFYHSNTKIKGVVGIAKITKEAYPDPNDNNWIVIDIAPVKSLDNIVELKTIKTNKLLQNLMLIKQSRLSVMPVSEIEFNQIIRLSTHN
ncbi:MAG: EVE domain-containing protein [Solitalea-like symbiont of Tyrophagus putrescentiae]